MGRLRSVSAAVVVLATAVWTASLVAATQPVRVSVEATWPAPPLLLEAR